MEKQFIYADNAATTKMSDVAVRAMLPYLQEIYANASSVHLLGQRSAAALFSARQQVAQVLNCAPKEVFFTSGGSEADNQALISAAALGKKQGKCHIVSTAMEHHAILHTLEALQAEGFTVTLLCPQANGIVTATQVAEAITDTTCLVSVMYANNETGAIQPIREIGALCRKRGVFFHTDAVQALGKVPVDFRSLNARGVHALTFSAHKIGGPKGAGALILDKRVEIEPLIAGGGHERGLRSGTENVAAIVGFGMACDLLAQRQEEQAARLSGLRQRLETGLRELGATIFGDGAPRLPNTVYFGIGGFDGETLVAQLDHAGYALASGAACSSANPEPSHVLRAMGVPDGLARAAVRASLGTGNTAAQVDGFLGALRATTTKLQHLTALAV